MLFFFWENSRTAFIIWIKGWKAYAYSMFYDMFWINERQNKNVTLHYIGKWNLIIQLNQDISEPYLIFWLLKMEKKNTFQGTRGKKGIQWKMKNQINSWEIQTGFSCKNSPLLCLYSLSLSETWLDKPNQSKVHLWFSKQRYSHHFFGLTLVLISQVLYLWLKCVTWVPGRSEA